MAATVSLNRFTRRINTLKLGFIGFMFILASYVLYNRLAYGQRSQNPEDGGNLNDASVYRHHSPNRTQTYMLGNVLGYGNRSQSQLQEYRNLNSAMKHASHFEKRLEESATQKISRIPCVGWEPGQDVDIFCMKRPKYLPEYKNPCWRISVSDGTSRFQCLPYFHLLGVDRSGTSDLFHRISLHKDFTKGSFYAHGKEGFYWSRTRYSGHMDFPKASTFCSFECYLAKLATASKNIENRHKRITGDGCPSDFWDLTMWHNIPQNRGLLEPVVMTPHLMRHVYENPKFIIIFRNPTQRTYTDYQKMVINPRRNFDDDIKRDIELMNTCASKRSLKLCAMDLQFVKTLSRARIIAGLYSVYLLEWLAVFPMKSFLILRTEDYGKDTKGTLRTVFDFLGLEYTDEVLARLAVERRIRVMPEKYKRGRLKNSTKMLLDEFYSQTNQDLAKMLNDQRFLWNDVR